MVLDWISIDHGQQGTDCFRCGQRWPCDVERLVAEVRRLRSDEWLEAAAGTFCDQWISEAEYGAETPARAKQELCDLLRKHRDGKA
jgi:hypothetical protein